MLWQIENTPHKLLGSVHVLPDGATLPSWVHEGCAGVGRFVFEADHRDPAADAVGRDSTGGCWKPDRHASAYHAAAELLAQAGDTNAFDGLKPWRAAFHFAQRMMSIGGLQHAHGLDNLLRTGAAKMGHQIDYLEGPTRAYDLLDSSCDPSMGGIAYFERVVRDTASGQAARDITRIIRAWAHADIGDLGLFLAERRDDAPFIFHPLITQRNREWLPVAAEMIHSDTPTLFVVGCLHTVGPDSFIDQLQSIGLQCRHIATNG